MTNAVMIAVIWAVAVALAFCIPVERRQGFGGATWIVAPVLTAALWIEAGVATGLAATGVVLVLYRHAIWGLAARRLWKRAEDRA